jgi:hypothetical protein
MTLRREEMNWSEIDHYGHDLPWDYEQARLVHRRRTYDLQTAHPILRVWVVGNRWGGKQTLYKTPEGYYFILVEPGMGLKPKLVPRSLQKARAWLGKIKNPPLVIDLY